MIQSIIILVAALAGIVLSSELFTNGVEWLGQRLQLGEGVVGSIFAAAGTALPETLIPFVAVIFFHEQNGHDVGIGAIAGAPFMLSTLTLAICGLSVLIFAKRGKRSADLNINTKLLSNDLRYFLIAYTLALLGTMLSPWPQARWILAAFIFLIYPYYVYETVKREQETGAKPEHLHFDRILRLGAPERLSLIIPQVVAGVGGILVGAWFFVDNVQVVAKDAGLQPLILSLVLCPVATELPEKINSVIWARNGKDTLALANITGALVFQSCIPVAFGVAFTKWALNLPTICTGIVALSAAFLYKYMLDRSKLQSKHLLIGGIAYFIVVSFVIAYDLATHTAAQ